MNPTWAPIPESEWCARFVVAIRKEDSTRDEEWAWQTDRDLYESASLLIPEEMARSYLGLRERRAARRGPGRQ
jgi:hypothetical protein